MEIVADALLIVGAFGLAGYCLLLSRRLRRLARSDDGLGATIQQLSARVDSLTRTAAAATEAADAAASRLAALLEEADRREADLSFALAGLGEEAPPPRPAGPVFARRGESAA